VRCVLPFLAILSLVGCGTRSEERTDYKWSGSITVPVPTAEGKIVPTPVPFKITGQANAEKIEKTGVDTDAVAEVVRTTIMAAMAGSGGMGWTTILSGAGALATAATTGYLALAKREQLKKAKG
jgi:hypothetical protein